MRRVTKSSARFLPRDDQFAHGNNVHPELPFGSAVPSCLSPQAASFHPTVLSAAQQTACLPHNGIVQLAVYQYLLTVDGGQSFGGDLLQYHLFMERLNFEKLPQDRFYQKL